MAPTTRSKSARRKTEDIGLPEVIADQCLEDNPAIPQAAESAPLPSDSVIAAFKLCDELTELLQSYAERIPQLDIRNVGLLIQDIVFGNMDISPVPTASEEAPSTLDTSGSPNQSSTQDEHNTLVASGNREEPGAFEQVSQGNLHKELSRNSTPALPAPSRDKRPSDIPSSGLLARTFTLVKSWLIYLLCIGPFARAPNRATNTGRRAEDPIVTGTERI